MHFNCNAFVFYGLEKRDFYCLIGNFSKESSSGAHSKEEGKKEKGAEHFVEFVKMV